MLKDKFAKKIIKPLLKGDISVLQVNLGRKCNQVCKHCHIEAGPDKTEEINEAVKNDIIKLIRNFASIKTVDITGGAPECHFGFKEIVEEARRHNKEVIVRSNLTIFFENGFRDMPDFFRENRVRVVASLPCYLEENVDAMRGKGVYKKSIQAIALLNSKGYGREFILDFVYNPAMPNGNFSLAPDQAKLEADYKKNLKERFGIYFNSLYVFNNIPLGRFYKHLKVKKDAEKYINFLDDNFNSATLPFLMCKNQISVDYKGRVYDCDFNLISGVESRGKNNKSLHIKDFIKSNSLDLIGKVQVRNYCFGCTAGSGSSCSGVLV